MNNAPIPFTVNSKTDINMFYIQLFIHIGDNSALSFTNVNAY